MQRTLGSSSRPYLVSYLQFTREAYLIRAVKDQQKPLSFEQKYYIAKLQIVSDLNELMKKIFKNSNLIQGNIKPMFGKNAKF